MKANRKEEVKMFRTSIALPENLYKRLAHVAVDENKTLRELMTEAIEEFITRKEKGGSKR